MYELTCIECKKTTQRIAVNHETECCASCFRVYITGTNFPVQGFDVGDRVYFDSRTKRLAAIPLEFEIQEIGRLE